MTATTAQLIAAADKKDNETKNTLAFKDSIIQTLQEPTAKIKTPWWSTHDAMTISASVLVFGALLMILATVAISRGIVASVVLRVYGLLTIIVMAVFLVVAGYDATQIGPVIGLLGTLAGYLVGRSSTTGGDPSTLNRQSADQASMRTDTSIKTAL